jgi:hypothetical protein
VEDKHGTQPTAVYAQFKSETAMDVLRGEKPTAQNRREHDRTDWLVYRRKQAAIYRY